MILSTEIVAHIVKLRLLIYTAQLLIKNTILALLLQVERLLRANKIVVGLPIFHLLLHPVSALPIQIVAGSTMPAIFKSIGVWVGWRHRPVIAIQVLVVQLLV